MKRYFVKIIFKTFFHGLGDGVPIPLAVWAFFSFKRALREREVNTIFSVHKSAQYYGSYMAMAPQDKCCGCANPKGLRVAADVLIAAAAIMLIIAILYLCFTDFNTVDKVVLYYEIALLFSSIIFIMAAYYLRIMVFENENYKKILSENFSYSSGRKPPRSCCHAFLSANTYLVIGWLALVGAAPLVLFPVPVFPYIMACLLFFIILFIIATLPPCLANNGGKGSLLFGILSSPTSGTTASKYFSSDVLLILLALSLFGIILFVATMINLATNFKNVTAWLWFASAFLFTFGLILWYRHSVPRYGSGSGNRYWSCFTIPKLLNSLSYTLYCTSTNPNPNPFAYIR